MLQPPEASGVSREGRAQHRSWQGASSTWEEVCTHACTLCYCFSFLPYATEVCRVHAWVTKEICVFTMFYYIWQSGHGHTRVRKCLTISFLSACLLGASSVHLLWKEPTTDRKTNSQNTQLPSHSVNTTLRCLPIKKWWTCEQMGKRDVLWTGGRSVPRLHSLRWLTGGPTAARAGEGRQPFLLTGRFCTELWRRRGAVSVAKSLREIKI